MIGHKIGYGILILVSGVGCSEPDNYDDCVLKHLKPGMDRAAVLAVKQACREKFPIETDKRMQDLTLVQLMKLTGRARISVVYSDHYLGSIYNGNDDIVVTEIRVNVTATINGVQVARLYRSEVYIPPRKKADFGFDIIRGDEGSSYGWSIESARGKRIE